MPANTVTNFLSEIDLFFVDVLRISEDGADFQIEAKLSRFLPLLLGVITTLICPVDFIVFLLLIIGVICPTVGVIHPKLPSYRILCHIWCRFNKCNNAPLTSIKIRDERRHRFLSDNYALSVGRNHHLATADNDFDGEPFWSILLKETLGILKSLFKFLVEQPSQLKYIEWPSFQSTLKTATLTLLLVGLLIIALSSVDSALCYILALLSRKRA